MSTELARLFALRGDLDRSRAWLASSRARLDRWSGDRIPPSASLRLTEVIVLAREGKTKDALRLLERDWRRIGQRDLASALFLRAHLVRESSSPRDAAASAPFELALRALEVDVRYVAREWPEIAPLDRAQASA